MSLLDVVVVVAAVSAALGGFRIGFLARVTSWVGLVVGAYLAFRVLPAAVGAVDPGRPPTRFLVAAAILLFGAFLGQAAGLVVGHRVRGVLPRGRARTVDRGVGAVAGGVGVVVTLWLLLPSVAAAPGWPARQARSSSLARFIDSALPEPPDTVRTLRRLMDERGFPKVFEALRPAPVVGPPPAASGLTPEVTARVAAGTVKVTGEACRRLQEGSGFVVQQDVVVTNAHVVAGEQQVSVLRPTDGRGLAANVAVFDADRDLAVLHVPGLGLGPLGRRTAGVGTTGAVFGHPLGQDQVRAAPTRVSERVRAVGRDIYDERRTERDVFILASDLQEGDSGAPFVAGDGMVVGVAFAVAPDRPGTAYAVTVTELDAVLADYAADPARRVGTGDCLVR